MREIERSRVILLSFFFAVGYYARENCDDVMLLLRHSSVTYLVYVTPLKNSAQTFHQKMSSQQLLSPTFIRKPLSSSSAQNWIEESPLALLLHQWDLLQSKTILITRLILRQHCTPTGRIIFSTQWVEIRIEIISTCFERKRLHPEHWKQVLDPKSLKHDCYPACSVHVSPYNLVLFKLYIPWWP
jgi:hypothetical protein